MDSPPSTGDARRVVYFHRGCTDGHVAAALFVAHADHADFDVCAAYPSLAGFVCPPPGSTAVFVDLCPDAAVAAELRRRRVRVHVYDHHLSSRDVCAGAAFERAQHHMNLCGAQVVDTFFPRAPGPAYEATTRKLAAVAAYDLWLDPDDDAFRFQEGVRVLWARATTRGAPTTADQCRAFLAAFAAAPYADIVALGAPALAEIEAEYRACAPHVLRLAPPGAPGAWDGTARAVALGPRSNVSVLLHWLLRDHPEEVAAGVWPAADGPARVSLRSRALCLPDALPWARGHAHACGGVLPN